MDPRIHTKMSWIRNTGFYVSLGEKPYKCRHCDTGFAQRTSLNVHMASHHKGVAPVSSPLKAGLEKTRVFKKKPAQWIFLVFVGFFCFFCFFWFFVYICPEERVFRVFSVSRIL
jgi:hypothetical protein